MTGMDMLILGGATLVAAFIKGGAGMGAGIFLQPTLTLIYDPFTALALSSPILLFSDTIGLFTYWREWIEWRKLAFLLAACSIGSAIGIMTVPFVTAEYMKLVVGLCGLSFVASKIIPSQKNLNFAPVSLTVLFLAAVLGGFFNAVANAGGIFFAYCCLRINLDPRRFVATIVIVVLTTSLFKVPGYVLIGILSFNQILHCLPLIPLVLAGALLGSRCNRHLNPKLFRTLVLIVIGIMSTSTLLSLF